jgi:hypothetical protein
VCSTSAAYDAYRIELPGPAPGFEPAAAADAARLVYRACWALVSEAEGDADLAAALAMPHPPRSAAEHASADLVLRYLPTVHRRARALGPDDCLHGLLADVLRRWPLSGVLSDVEEGPLTPPDFDGHPGLLLLYAERLSRNEKPAWVPRGPGREQVELVWAALGRDAVTLLSTAPAGEGEGDA